MAKPPRKKPGPPKDVPRITSEQFKMATTALRMGMTVTDACRLAGMNRDSFYKWKRIGESMPHGEDPKADPLPRQFADAVANGELTAKHTALASIYNGMRKDWKAGAWLLSVRAPKEYGPKIRVTLETEFDAALERLEKVLPPELYEKALAAIAGGQGDEEDSGPPPGDVGPRLE